MKNIFLKSSLASLLVVGLAACNDNFMERYPVTQPAETSAFNSFATASAYLQSLYPSLVTDYSQGPKVTSGAVGTSQRDMWSGIITNGSGAIGTHPNGYANQNSDVVPTESAYFNNPYIYIRRANILLEHVPDMNISDDEKSYLEGVGRFFRAWNHYGLMINYGDVIYVDHSLTENSEEMQGTRNSRLFVTQKVYEDLKWCIDHMSDKPAVANEINTDVVKAFMSRFALFEGTWRKYHNVDESACSSNGWITGSELIKLCADVSEGLIQKHSVLYTGTGIDNYPGKGWGQLWTTENLAGVPGVLLYDKFVEDYKMHRIGHFEHIASATMELPQSTIDLYLTKDGLPIHNPGVKYYDYVDGQYVDASEPYDYANCNIYKTFRNRDPRMWQTVMPPYYVTLVGTNGYIREEDPSPYNEYLNQFPNRGVLQSDGSYLIRAFNASYDFSMGHKTLPSGNWGGNTQPNVPNVLSTNKNASTVVGEGLIGLYQGRAFQRLHSGYFFWKHHAGWDRQDQNVAKEISDKPLFHIEETMLNYAEAKFELGQFNQGIADMTINKLRQRAEVGEMNVGQIDGNFDPDRDQTVDPVLWEIRRERIIELMGESFSWDDVRRWKKADYFVNKQPYGIFVENVSKVLIPNIVAGLTTGIRNPETGGEYTKAELEAAGDKGHLYYYIDPVKAGKGWLDKFYLNPIPSDEILLNPNLSQNSGWE